MSDESVPAPSPPRDRDALDEGASERDGRDGPLVAQPGWDKELSTPNYEIFIGMVSLLSLVNMVLYYVVTSDKHLEGILSFMNYFLSLLFMGDFAARLITSRNRADYFFRRFGWADLLGSLPFHSAKALRLFRLIRVYRVVRKYGARNLVLTMIRDRAGSSLFLMLLLGILVLEFGSLAILKIEGEDPAANIKTSSDALWYVIETISTVGYGDMFPVTNPGRLVGSMIIIVGVGIFGTFTGYLANFFISPSRKATQGADG